MHTYKNFLNKPWVSLAVMAAVWLAGTEVYLLGEMRSSAVLMFIAASMELGLVIGGLCHVVLRAAQTKKKYEPLEPAANNNGDNEVLDTVMTDELRVLMNEEFIAILRNYLVITPKLLSELATAITKSQAKDVERISHRLKSSSAQVGAAKFAALAKNIEYSASKGDLDIAPNLFAEAAVSYQNVGAALQAVQER